MYPILFEIGSITIYSYGFFIAVGAILGLIYMARQGKKRFGITYDQSNSLFIYIVVAAYVGGKVFFFFENPTYYVHHIGKLFSGNGFVFFGSLLFAIPTMLWFFKKNKIPTLPMLDVMAIVTCIVHGFGRIGCFMSGCCHGQPTDSFLSVIFTNPVCQAEPLNTPLHPTQLYESAFIFSLMATLLWIKSRKKFDGQLFLIYLIVYSIGRSFLEMLRGDEERGFLIQDVLSHSQFISLIVIAIAIYFYVKLKRKGKLLNS
ncbi:MAG: prolipoprotein diacylglyceryl transferase [Cyclobacteriaceae bacterium]|nr:prolipoprotein diacylglyceryl transferase [Cyclobacteriaceae bacterium]